MHKGHLIKTHDNPQMIMYVIDASTFDEVLDKADREKVRALLTHFRNNTKAKFWVTTRLRFDLSTFAVKKVHTEKRFNKTHDNPQMIMYVGTDILRV